MICHVCRCRRSELAAERYHYRQCGLHNVYLLNAEVIRCGCGDSICIPLFPQSEFDRVHFPIVEQLLKKPERFTRQEFTFVFKNLMLEATCYKAWAEQLGFYGQALYRSNDWSRAKWDYGLLLAFKGMRQITVDDQIINEELSKELRACLAKLLGFNNAAALVAFNHTPGHALIPGALDEKVRHLVILARKNIKIRKCRAVSLFTTDGQQTIEVTMPSQIENFKY